VTSPGVDAEPGGSVGSTIRFGLVPWDTDIFGFPVAEIAELSLPPGTDGATALGPFLAWCATHEVRLAVCRLDHDRLHESMALEEAGFRFIESVHAPRFELDRPVDPPDRTLRVRRARPGDLEALQAIAASAFTTGRYLVDWRLPPELNHRRYAAWVGNAIRSSDQVVLVAEDDDTLVGFFIVERRPDGTEYWHLTAVAPSMQGRGYGLRLWRTMLSRAREEGAGSVETTISAHNLPVMSLYARLGFGFAATRMTFHRIFPERPILVPSA